MNIIFRQRLVPIDEEMVTQGWVAHLKILFNNLNHPFRQVNGAVFQPFGLSNEGYPSRKVNISQTQILQLTNTDATLPQQVKGGQIKLRVSFSGGSLCLLHLLSEVIA